MKTLKKYINPLAFSAIFLVFWNVLVIILNATADNDGYGALGIGIFILLVWVLIVIPIHCIKYSKIIIDGKLKILFSAYNCLVLTVVHLLPFGWKDEISVVGIFFAWVMLWSVLPVILRLCSRENKDKILKKDDTHLINFLLQNKKKNIIAICTTGLYIISCLMNSMTWEIFNIKSFLIYTLPLISTVVFLVLLFSKNKEYFFKKWLLTFSFSGELISTLFSVLFSLGTMDMNLKYIPNYPIKLSFSCLMTILLAIMFIASLFNFKYINLLKYGALGCAILSVISILIGQINVTRLIGKLIQAAYFIGIFILTTNKRETDQAL